MGERLRLAMEAAGLLFIREDGDGVGVWCADLEWRKQIKSLKSQPTAEPRGRGLETRVVRCQLVADIRSSELVRRIFDSSLRFFFKSRTNADSSVLMVAQASEPPMKQRRSGLIRGAISTFMTSSESESRDLLHQKHSARGASDALFPTVCDERYHIG
jgi:hypothetical protein